MTSPDINASQLRLYYLQQLGIAAYVPRELSAVDVEEELPQSAATSTAMAVESAAQHVAAAPMAAAIDEVNDAISAARAAPATEPRPAAARRLVVEEDEVAPRVVPAAPIRTATTAATETDEETVLPFQLLLVVLDTELAIALQIPALAGNGLREHEQKLLQNLLRWLGYPLPDLKSSLQYRWPLPGLPAGSAAIAARTLTVFLQQAASTRPFRHLLLLGPVPAQCLQDQPAAWQLWPTHSLAELLALPQLKRDTWLQLQPLQHQLQQKLH